MPTQIVGKYSVFKKLLYRVHVLKEYAGNHERGRNTLKFRTIPGVLKHWCA